MKKLFNLCLLAMVGSNFVSVLPAYSGPSAGTKFWFGNTDVVVQKDNPARYQPSDWMQLFEPNAPWQKSLSHLTGLGVSTQFIKRGSDEQVKTVLDWCREHNVGLTIELGVILRDEYHGGGEGHVGPRDIDFVCSRVKRLGGQVDYVSMDEPVVYGHLKTGNTYLGTKFYNYPIPMLVDKIAPQILQLKSYFPDVQIGEIDAIGAGHVDDYIQFVDLLHQKTGLKLAFFHIDMQWGQNWQPSFKDLLRRMHGRGIRVGVVLNGDIKAKSDKEFVAATLNKYRLLTSDSATTPDNIIIGSWSSYPTRNLPETDPCAWTYALRMTELKSNRR